MMKHNHARILVMKKRGLNRLFYVYQSATSRLHEGPNLHDRCDLSWPEFYSVCDQRQHIHGLNIKSL